MRFLTLALLCFSLVLAAPLSASAKSKQDKGPEIIAKLLAKVLESAGNSVSTETEMVDSEAMGDGNEIVQIESLVLNINIGDIVINSNESQGDGGATELAFRLLDFMGMAHEQMNNGGGGHGGPDMPMGHPDMGMKQGGHGNMPMGHPNMDMKQGGHGDMPIGHPNMDMPMHPDMPMRPGMDNPHGNMRMDGPHGNAPMMGGSRGIGNPHGKDHPQMDGHGNMRREIPNHDNPGFHPEVWEMLHEIPMDVDPDFFCMMMQIAQMAWERPELREHLEQMIRRMEQGEDDRRPHGR